MVEKIVKETVREYDKEGKLVKETVKETTEKTERCSSPGITCPGWGNTAPVLTAQPSWQYTGTSIQTTLAYGVGPASNIAP